MQQLVAACRTQAFRDLARSHAASRGASIGEVLDRCGSSGLLAIVDEISEAMDQWAPARKADALVGFEAGVVYGIAVATAVSGKRSRESKDNSIVH